MAIRNLTKYVDAESEPINPRYLEIYDQLSKTSFFKEIKTLDYKNKIFLDNSKTSEYYSTHPEAMIPGLILTDIFKNNIALLKIKLLLPLENVLTEVLNISKVLENQDGIIKKAEAVFSASLVRMMKQELSQTVKIKFLENIELQNKVLEFRKMSDVLLNLKELSVFNILDLGISNHIDGLLESVISEYDKCNKSIIYLNSFLFVDNDTLDDSLFQEDSELENDVLEYSVSNIDLEESIECLGDINE